MQCESSGTEEECYPIDLVVKCGSRSFEGGPSTSIELGGASDESTAEDAGDLGVEGDMGDEREAGDAEDTEDTEDAMDAWSPNITHVFDATGDILRFPAFRQKHDGCPLKDQTITETKDDDAGLHKHFESGRMNDGQVEFQLNDADAQDNKTYQYYIRLTTELDGGDSYTWYTNDNTEPFTFRTVCGDHSAQIVPGEIEDTEPYVLNFDSYPVLIIDEFQTESTACRILTYQIQDPSGNPMEEFEQEGWG